MLSATCHPAPLDSECDPKQVPRAVGTRAPKFQASTPAGSCAPALSSRVPAIGSSPKGDISADCLYLPSDTSPKNLPGSWATHGMQHGQTEPCSCLPSHRGLQPQEEPVSTHGLMGFKLLWDQLGAFGCRRGRRRATHAGWSGRQEVRLLLGEALQGLPLYCFLPLQSCPGPGFQ